MLAKTAPAISLSIEVLSTLLLLLGASAAAFWLLVRRWASHRPWLAVIVWGRENGFRVEPCDSGNHPPPLNAIAARDLEIQLCLVGATTTLVRVQTAPVQTPQGMPASTGKVTWNLLIRHLQTVWRPTGLRPTSSHGSFLDLYSLSSFPLLGSTERFTIFGTDSAVARALSDSMIRSLLPADVGLLLYGNELVFDFSDRPFDEIEFNRMLSLANQIAQKLPPLR